MRGDGLGVAGQDSLVEEDLAVWVEEIGGGWGGGDYGDAEGIGDGTEEGGEGAKVRG